MAITTIYSMAVNGGETPKDPTMVDQIISLIGSPSIAMLISLVFAMFTMGWGRVVQRLTSWLH